MSNKENLYRKSAFLYDLDMRDIVKSDIPFYKEYAKKANGNILELACGTGRVSIELAKNNYKVDCLDLSEDMLVEFKKKLENLPEKIQTNIKLIQGNMSNFNMNKKYNLIIVPFRSFQSLTEEKDINKSLNCIRGHLTAYGMFIINAFKPYKKLDESWISGEKLQWETTDHKTGYKIKKYDIRKKIDVEKQIVYPDLKYVIEKKNGEIEVFEEPLKLKYYYYDQLKDLLLNNKFEIIDEFGYYDKTSIDNGKELIFVCQKKNSLGETYE